MSAIGSGKFVEGIAKKITEKVETPKVILKAEEKAVEKLSTETVNISRNALKNGSLGKAMKLSFVERPNPVNVIKEANEIYQKRNPELVKLKYEAMSESLFAFYRATAYLFFTDAAAEKALATKVKIPVQGDLHLENIGTYKTSKGEIAYDLNDFDDAVAAPYTVDLARMATSIRIAAQESGLGNESDKLVDEFVKDYLKHLGEVSENPAVLELPLTESNAFGKHTNKVIEKSEEITHEDFLSEMVQDGKFIRNNKQLSVSAEIKQKVTGAVQEYSKQFSEGRGFYEVKDVIFRVAGKASLGRNRFTVLVEGKSSKGKNDIILELKEAAQPSASKALGEVPGNQAKRVINAIKEFVPDADPRLGTVNIDGIDYFVRELSVNEKVNLEKLDKPEEFKDHLEGVALVVARSHARSGKAQEIMKDAVDTGSLQKRIGDFTRNYEKQVELDYKAFKEAVSGK